MRNEHVWKETTPEGERREVRASKFGNNWRIQSKLQSEENWTYHDEPPLEDWKQLHDILFRKYQRKRLPYEDVQAIERKIKDLERQAGK
ncbi:MAG: hypothetical protein QM796_06190 [Chthoniobacteraceae bacterium]